MLECKVTLADGSTAVTDGNVDLNIDPTSLALFTNNQATITVPLNNLGLAATALVAQNGGSGSVYATGMNLKDASAAALPDTNTTNITVSVVDTFLVDRDGNRIDSAELFNSTPDLRLVKADDSEFAESDLVSGQTFRRYPVMGKVSEWFLPLTNAVANTESMVIRYPAALSSDGIPNGDLFLGRFQGNAGGRAYSRHVDVVIRAEARNFANNFGMDDYRVFFSRPTGMPGIHPDAQNEQLILFENRPNIPDTASYAPPFFRVKIQGLSGLAAGGSDHVRLKLGENLTDVEVPIYKEGDNFITPLLMVCDEHAELSGKIGLEGGGEVSLDDAKVKENLGGQDRTIPILKTRLRAQLGYHPDAAIQIGSFASSCKLAESISGIRVIRASDGQPVGRMQPLAASEIRETPGTPGAAKFHVELAHPSLAVSTKVIGMKDSTTNAFTSVSLQRQGGAAPFYRTTKPVVTAVSLDLPPTDDDGNLVTNQLDSNVIAVPVASSGILEIDPDSGLGTGPLKPIVKLLRPKKYMTMGDSLTAGFQSFALRGDEQDFGHGVQAARQMGLPFTISAAQRGSSGVFITKDIPTQAPRNDHPTPRPMMARRFHGWFALFLAPLMIGLGTLPGQEAEDAGEAYWKDYLLLLKIPREEREKRVGELPWKWIAVGEGRFIGRALKTPGMSDRLKKLVEDPAFQHKPEAGVLLFMLGDVSKKDLVSKQFSTGDPWQRTLAAVALHRTGDRSVVPWCLAQYGELSDKVWGWEREVKKLQEKQRQEREKKPQVKGMWSDLFSADERPDPPKGVFLASTRRSGLELALSRMNEIWDQDLAIEYLADENPAVRKGALAVMRIGSIGSFDPSDGWNHGYDYRASSGKNQEAIEALKAEWNELKPMPDRRHYDWDLVWGERFQTDEDRKQRALHAKAQALWDAYLQAKEPEEKRKTALAYIAYNKETHGTDLWLDYPGGPKEPAPSAESKRQQAGKDAYYQKWNILHDEARLRNDGNLEIQAINKKEGPTHNGWSPELIKEGLDFLDEMKTTLRDANETLDAERLKRYPALVVLLEGLLNAKDGAEWQSFQTQFRVWYIGKENKLNPKVRAEVESLRSSYLKKLEEGKRAASQR